MNPHGVMQAKLFEYKTPDRTYRLALIVSNQLFSASSTSTQETTRHNKIFTIDRYYGKYFEI
jgi:hypothetical protein